MKMPQVLLSAIFAVTVFLLAEHPVVFSSGEVFRVTEYFVSGEDFSGYDYNLFLENPLSADHFVLLRGAADGNTTRGADSSYVRVSALPSGTNAGLPASSGNNVITLSRYAKSGPWVGTVSVVECLRECDTKGFRLRDVLDITTSGTATNGSAVSNPWTDTTRVVPFGGPFGSGSNVAFSGKNPQNRFGSAWISLIPNGTNSIEWSRYDSGRYGLVTARHTVHVVEWGSEWSVQTRTIYDKAGGNGVDAVSEYNTKNITPVSRENTWVWGTGFSQNAGIGDGAEAVVYTLGNGVDTDPTESTVALGSEYSALRYFTLSIMSHPDLSVEYAFKKDGDSKAFTFDIPLSSSFSSGQRLSWSTNTCNGTTTAYPRPIFSSRYIDDSTIRLERQYAGQNFAAWVQAVDFSGLSFSSEPSLGLGFVNSRGETVMSSLVSMSEAVASLRSQIVSGILGTPEERIRVTASGENTEWSLSLAPADGHLALWRDGEKSYDINDHPDTGLDATDPDSVGGSMSVDFSAISVVTDPECFSAITILGSESAFLEGIIDSVFLASSRVPLGQVSCYWDISGIGLDQVIPPGQEPGDYSIDMVLTVTAI